MPVYNAFRSILLGLLMVLAVSAPAHADTIFSINNAKVVPIGNGHVLQANIQYPLTPRVIEAIDNGVPVTFYQEFELYESTPILGDLWDWENTQWKTILRYELRYHALPDRFVLIAVDTEEQRSFQSLDAALRALGNIENLNLPPEHIQDSDSLKLRLRSGIDLHALPTPMRPGALISDKWQLDTPWVEALWQ